MVAVVRTRAAITKCLAGMNGFYPSAGGMTKTQLPNFVRAPFVVIYTNEK
jgi:hypothetical protein